MPNVNFYFAGEGNYLPIIKNKCKKLKNVTFLGPLSLEQCRKFYESINIYLLPTGLDACPTTLLEAALMNKPGIVSNIG